MAEVEPPESVWRGTERLVTGKIWTAVLILALGAGVGLLIAYLTSSKILAAFGGLIAFAIGVVGLLIYVRSSVTPTKQLAFERVQHTKEVAGLRKEVDGLRSRLAPRLVIEDVQEQTYHLTDIWVEFPTLPPNHYVNGNGRRKVFKITNHSDVAIEQARCHLVKDDQALPLKWVRPGSKDEETADIGPGLSAYAVLCGTIPMAAKVPGHGDHQWLQDLGFGQVSEDTEIEVKAWAPKGVVGDTKHYRYGPGRPQSWKSHWPWVPMLYEVDEP